MRAFIVLTLFSFSVQSFSQKFDGYVVTLFNDTIPAKFFVPTDPSDKTRLFPTIRSKVKILNDKGERKTYVPRQLKSFLIKGTKDGDYKFVTLKEDPTEFYQELLTGRISCYNSYHNTAKSIFPVLTRYFLKNGNLVIMGELAGRGKLGELIADHPTLYKEWMDGNSFKIHETEKVVRLYNAHFETLKR